MQAKQILLDYLQEFGPILKEYAKTPHKSYSNKNENENLEQQREYAIVAAALSQILSLDASAPEEDLISDVARNCSKVPLALGLCIKTMVESQRFDLAKQIYEDFLISPHAQMSLKERCELFPSYIEFLRRYTTPKEIRQAERQYLNIQKELRLQLIDERREECKDTSNLSEIMDRWILYLQETEQLQRGFQETE